MKAYERCKGFRHLTGGGALAGPPYEQIQNVRFDRKSKGMALLGKAIATQVDHVLKIAAFPGDVTSTHAILFTVPTAHHV